MENPIDEEQVVEESEGSERKEQLVLLRDVVLVG